MNWIQRVRDELRVAWCDIRGHKYAVVWDGLGRTADTLWCRRCHVTHYRLPKGA